MQPFGYFIDGHQHYFPLLLVSVAVFDALRFRVHSVYRLEILERQPASCFELPAI